MRTSTDAKTAKPIYPIHQRLRISWVSWLLSMGLLYPAVVALSSDASLLAGVAVQLLALIPALLFTPMIWRGRSAYGLIVASFITLVYLGVAGVLLLIRYYEQSPALVWAVLVLHLLLLMAINYYLFILLKRLPPMHKNKP